MLDSFLNQFMLFNFHFSFPDKSPEIGSESIMKLLKEIDNYIPTPQRDLDKHFFMPIEHVFSIPNRGTVCSGLLEQGVIKKGNDCEIVGYNKTIKSTVTGVEMFHQLLDQAQAGDQLGVLVRGVKRDEIRRGMILCKPGTHKMNDHVMPCFFHWFHFHKKTKFL